MGTVLIVYIYYVYIPLTLITMRHFSQHAALSINIISLSLVIILIPLFGKLSDYYSRIKLLKIICLIISLMGLPFFWFTSYGSYFEILALSLLISIPSSCFFSIYPTFLIEKIPSKIRCTTSSLIYQIVFSVVLGTLPLIVNQLVGINKTPLFTFAYLLIFSVCIAYFGLLILELNPTVPRYAKLKQRRYL